MEGRLLFAIYPLRGPVPLPSRSALLDFLDQPAIAVWIAQGHVTVVVSSPGFKARGLSFWSEVEGVAHVHSTSKVL